MIPLTGIKFPNMVVVEGPDATGKSTSCRLVKHWLQEKHERPVEILKFPNYDSVTSGIITQYLHKDFDLKIDPIFKAKSIANMYAVDRSITMHSNRDGVPSMVERMMQEPRTIFLLDRYTPSNILHQAASLKEEQVEDFAEWLYDLEFNHLNLPIPNICFYIIPENVEVIERNIATRGGNPDLLEEREAMKQSIHLLQKSEAGKKALFENFPANHVHRIHINMASEVEQTAEKIYQKIIELNI